MISAGSAAVAATAVFADPAEWPDPAQPKRRTRHAFAASLGLLPFGIYTALFLVVPAGAVVIQAFRSPTGHWTWANIATATHGIYLHGFITTIELSLITSIIPGILGLIVANAVLTSRGRVLKRVVSTASGVFAQFGGVPLAFLFISGTGHHRSIDWLAQGSRLRPLGSRLRPLQVLRGRPRLHVLPAPSHGPGHHSGPRGAAAGLAGGGLGHGSAGLAVLALRRWAGALPVVSWWRAPALRRARSRPTRQPRC